MLAESHNAVEQHGIALDSMRLKLRALHADAFEAAASDAAKVREQVGGTIAPVRQLQRPFVPFTNVFCSSRVLSLDGVL